MTTDHTYTEHTLADLIEEGRNRCDHQALGELLCYKPAYSTAFAVPADLMEPAERSMVARTRSLGACALGMGLLEYAHLTGQDPHDHVVVEAFMASIPERTKAHVVRWNDCLHHTADEICYMLRSELYCHDPLVLRTPDKRPVEWVADATQVEEVTVVLNPKPATPKVTQVA